MQSIHKIEYHFAQNPQYNISLEPDQTYLAQLIKQAFSLKQVEFIRQGADVLEEEWLDNQIQQIFIQYIHKNDKYSLKGFLIYWLENDNTLSVNCKEYDQFKQQARVFIEKVNEISINKVLQEQIRIAKQSAGQNLTSFMHQINKQNNQNSFVIPSVQFNQQPQPFVPDVQSPISKKGSTFQSSIFSKKCFDDILSIKKRLRSLFTLYNRKHYRNNTSLTFDQIPNQIASFNLNVWMMFNRDFGFLKTLKKSEVHGLFKKYSEKQMMSYQLFEVAILQIFRRVFPGDKKQGWKVLSVDSDQSYNLKKKQFGIPHIQSNIQNIYNAYSYIPVPDKMKIQTKSPIKTHSKIFQKAKLNDSLSLRKKQIEQIQSPFIFDNQVDDKIYLKQYQLNSPSINKNGSVGLLKRLDQRMKKYVKS